jgi:methyl-accepting chemotaxis protein-2 (aspartate sensor receptor)
MEQAHVNYRSVAQRLVLASIGMLALVLLAISVAMSAIAERQSRERIVASVAEKAQSVANSVDAFDATARALVERAFGPFRETFDPVLVLDEGTGKLSSFGVPSTTNTAQSTFSKDTGGVATVFARKGEDFVRIASSVKQDNGERAQGTLLERSDPAYAAVVAGKVYTGRTSLSGKPYMALYQPMKDAAGKVAGVLFVGFDLTGFQNSLEKLVGEARFFDSGGVYIIAPGAKPDEASFVVHASAKGKKVLQAYPAADKFLQALATTPTGYVPDAGHLRDPDRSVGGDAQGHGGQLVGGGGLDREAMRSHWITMYMHGRCCLPPSARRRSALVGATLSAGRCARLGQCTPSAGRSDPDLRHRQHDEIGALVASGGRVSATCRPCRRCVWRWTA